MSALIARGHWVDAAVAQGVPAGAGRGARPGLAIAGAAALPQARAVDTLAVRRAVDLTGRSDRARAARPRSRPVCAAAFASAAAAVASAAERQDDASSSASVRAQRSPTSSRALAWVYSVRIIAYILTSLVLGRGAQDAVLALGDAANLTFLRTERVRALPAAFSAAILPSSMGGLDFNPIVGDHRAAARGHADLDAIR